MNHPLELIHPRNLKHLSSSLHGLVAARLWLQVLLGMVLGIGAGIVLGPSAALVDRETANTISAWLILPGNIFLTIIQMIVIPLEMGSATISWSSHPFQDLLDAEFLNSYINPSVFSE